MNRIKYRVYFFILSCFLLSECGKDEQQNILTVSPVAVSFLPAGGSVSISVNTNANSWAMVNSVSAWVTSSTTTGSAGITQFVLTVNSHAPTARSGKLTITAGNAAPVEINVSQTASDYLYDITVDQSLIGFEKSGGNSTLTVSTDAPSWTISKDADWLQLNTSSGSNGVTAVTITALSNPSDTARTAVITIAAQQAAPVTIQVTQKGAIYPSYNTTPLPSDATGMSSTATELASKIALGWNLGNTLEAIGGETAWANPKASKALIDLVKQNGFNAIRIPCSWDQYVKNRTTAELKADWLDRVKEVVQYCVDNDLYVILNIHWDGGWLENNCVPAKQEANNAKQRAFWEQIATHLRDFDEHLLFASANEPNVDDATQMAVLTSYHQTFVNAVRSTGGKNSYRVLVVQGPSTDIDKTNTLMTALPTDSIENRMMAEVHYYTPWNFCGLTEDATWGKMFYYWGQGNHATTDTDRNPTFGEEADLTSSFAKMKAKFVDKGIPVVLGEFGAIRRSSLTGDALALHLKSRAAFFKYVTQQAKANGILPFYWDAGSMANNGDALFNRNNNTIFDQQAIDALVQGVK